VTGSLLWHGPSDSNGWTESRGVLDTCYLRLGFNYSANTGITWTVRSTKAGHGAYDTNTSTPYHNFVIFIDL
jgi:hypothetical protein